jgi:hypothetical protein
MLTMLSHELNHAKDGKTPRQRLPCQLPTITPHALSIASGNP